MERIDLSEEESIFNKSIHLARYQLPASIANGKSVLDIGCGNGYGSNILALAKASFVCGIDASQSSIEKARNTFRQSNLKFEQFEVSPKSEAQLGLFDLITCIETLEHVENPSYLLQFIARNLMEGGLAFITIPNDYYFYEESESNPFHLNKWTFSEFQELVGGVFQHAVFLSGLPVIGFASIFSRTIEDQLLVAPVSPLGDLAKPAYFAALCTNRWDLLNGLDTVAAPGHVYMLDMNTFFGKPNSEFCSPFDLPANLVSQIERLSIRMKEQDALIQKLVVSPRLLSFCRFVVAQMQRVERTRRRIFRDSEIRRGK